MFISLLSACTTTPTDENNNAGDTVTQQLLGADSVIHPQTNPGSLSQLFAYHNKLTVNNQLTFDVLSLGTPHTGGYLILKSDVNQVKYTAMSGERDGYITGSNAADLDADDQIEILIYLKKDKEGHGSIIIHEIDSLNNQTKISIPNLTNDLSEGYVGRDTFYVANSKVVREFPVYENNKPAGKRRRIEYVLKNNALLPSGHEDKNQ